MTPTYQRRTGQVEKRKNRRRRRRRPNIVVNFARLSSLLSQRSHPIVSKIHQDSIHHIVFSPSPIKPPLTIDSHLHASNI